MTDWAKYFDQELEKLKKQRSGLQQKLTTQDYKFDTTPAYPSKPKATQPAVTRAQSSKRSGLLDTLKNIGGSFETAFEHKMNEIKTDANEIATDFKKGQYGELAKDLIGDTVGYIPVTGHFMRGAIKGNDNTDHSLGAEAGQNFTAGIGDLVKGVGDAERWLSHDKYGKGLSNFAEKNLIKPYEKNYTKKFGWHSLLDPEFYATEGSRALPFMLSMFIPGMGGAKAGMAVGEIAANAAKLGKFGQTVVKTIAGGAGAHLATGPMEAAFEAAQTYDQAKKEGHDDNTAHSMANKTFIQNEGLLALSETPEYAMIFAPLLKGMGPEGAVVADTLLKQIGKTAGKVVGSAALEGGQEYLQQGIQDKSMGKSKSIFKPADMSGALEQGALGALMGGGMAVGTHLFEGKSKSNQQPKPTSTPNIDPVEQITKTLGEGADPQAIISSNVRNRMSDALKTEVDNVSEILKANGKTPAEIEKHIDDFIATTDEGQQLIQDETQNLLKRVNPELAPKTEKQANQEAKQETEKQTEQAPVNETLRQDLASAMEQVVTGKMPQQNSPDSQLTDEQIQQMLFGAETQQQTEQPKTHEPSKTLEERKQEHMDKLQEKTQESVLQKGDTIRHSATGHVATYLGTPNPKNENLVSVDLDGKVVYWNKERIEKSDAIDDNTEQFDGSQNPEEDLTPEEESKRQEQKDTANTDRKGEKFLVGSTVTVKGLSDEFIVEKNHDNATISLKNQKTGATLNVGRAAATLVNGPTAETNTEKTDVSKMHLYDYAKHLKDLGKGDLYNRLIVKPELRQGNIDGTNGEEFKKVQPEVNKVKDKLETNYDNWVQNKEQHKGVKPHGYSDNGWNHFILNSGTSKNEDVTHKAYATFKNFKDLTPENVNKMLKTLADAGYNGELKIPGSGARIWTAYDNMVIHGKTKEDAAHGAEIAKKLFGNMVDIHIGLDRKVNGEKKSHTEATALEAEKGLDWGFDTSNTEEVLKQWKGETNEPAPEPKQPKEIKPSATDIEGIITKQTNKMKIRESHILYSNLLDKLEDVLRKDVSALVKTKWLWGSAKGKDDPMLTAFVEITGANTSLLGEKTHQPLPKEAPGHFEYEEKNVRAFMQNAVDNFFKKLGSTKEQQIKALQGIKEQYHAEVKKKWKTYHEYSAFNMDNDFNWNAKKITGYTKAWDKVRDENQIDIVADFRGSFDFYKAMTELENSLLGNEESPKTESNPHMPTTQEIADWMNENKDYKAQPEMKADSKLVKSLYREIELFYQGKIDELVKLAGEYLLFRAGNNVSRPFQHFTGVKLPWEAANKKQRNEVIEKLKQATPKQAEVKTEKTPAKVSDEEKAIRSILKNDPDLNAKDVQEQLMWEELSLPIDEIEKIMQEIKGNKEPKVKAEESKKIEYPTEFHNLLDFTNKANLQNALDHFIQHEGIKTLKELQSHSKLKDLSVHEIINRLGANYVQERIDELSGAKAEREQQKEEEFQQQMKKHEEDLSHLDEVLNDLSEKEKEERAKVNAEIAKQGMANDFTTKEYPVNSKRTGLALTFNGGITQMMQRKMKRLGFTRLLKVDPRQWRKGINVLSETDETTIRKQLKKDHAEYVREQKKKAEEKEDKALAEVVTQSGRKIQVAYEIAEVDSLTASNNLNGSANPNYPKELQPRDRSSQTSKEQIRQMAKNLDPMRLGENRLASEGAPIIGKDGIVESGNGRTLAVMEMYDNFADDKEFEYREFLEKFIKEHDMDIIYDINEFQQPILVRVRLTELSNTEREKFVAEANESSVSKMGATETALADAKKLKDIIHLFVPSESGEVNTAQNQEFVKKFINQVVPSSERGEVRTKEGYLSQDGKERLERALFALAYEDAKTIARYSEDLDDNARTVTGAMTDVAPKLAVLNTDIENKEILSEFDIRKDIVSAFNQLVELRRKGENIKKWIDEDKAQESLFADTKLSDSSYELLTQFDKLKSRNKIRALLSNYIEYVMNDPRSKGEDLFGDKATKEEFLQIAIERMNGGGDLFELETQTRPSEIKNPSKKPGTEEGQTETSKGETTVVNPLPENPKDVDKEHFKAYVGKMKALIQEFSKRIENGTMPKGKAVQKDIRKIASDILGRPAQEDEWRDTLEAAIQSVYQTKINDKMSMQEKIKIGQELEEYMKNTGRSMEQMERQQFSTPIPLAEIVHYVTPVDRYENVRDGAAGTGSLLLPYKGKVNGTGGTELSPRRAAITQALGLGVSNYSIFDIKQVGSDGEDAIVGNPPFKGQNKHSGTVDLSGKPPWKGGWGDLGNRFLAWDLRLLKNGGRLTYIVSGGVIDSAQNREFRKWLKDNHTVLAMVKFPSGVYDTRGTKWPTGLIVVEKGKAKQNGWQIGNHVKFKKDGRTGVITGFSDDKHTKGEPIVTYDHVPKPKNDMEYVYKQAIASNPDELLEWLAPSKPITGEYETLDSLLDALKPLSKQDLNHSTENKKDKQKAHGANKFNLPNWNEYVQKHELRSFENPLNLKVDDLWNLVENWSDANFTGYDEKVRKAYYNYAEKVYKLVQQKFEEKAFSEGQWNLKTGELLEGKEPKKKTQEEMLADLKNFFDEADGTGQNQEPPKNVQANNPTKYVKARQKLSRFDRLAANAEKYMEDNKHRLNALPLDLYVAAAIVGANKMTHGIVDFAEWSESMMKDYGKKIRLSLHSLYSQSQQMLSWTDDDWDEYLADTGTEFLDQETEEEKPEEQPKETKKSTPKPLDKKTEQAIKDLPEVVKKGIEKNGKSVNSLSYAQLADEVYKWHEALKKEWVKTDMSSEKGKEMYKELQSASEWAKKYDMQPGDTVYYTWGPDWDLSQVHGTLEDTGHFPYGFYTVIDSRPDVEEPWTMRREDLSLAPQLGEGAIADEMVSDEGKGNSRTGSRDENADVHGEQPERDTTAGGKNGRKQSSGSRREGTSRTGTVHGQKDVTEPNGTSDASNSSFTSEQETVSANVPEKANEPNGRHDGTTETKGTNGPISSDKSSDTGYVPGRLVTGVPHMGNVTEAPNMRFVKFPEDMYQDEFLPHPIVLKGGKWKLSDVQIETVMAAKYNYSLGKNGILLADDTGMGKTASQLGVAADAWHSGRTKRILIVTTKDQVVTSSFLPENENLGFKLPITWISPNNKEYNQKYGDSWKDADFNGASNKEYTPFEVGDGVIAMSKYTFRDAQESVIKWLEEAPGDVTIMMDESHEFSNRESGLGEANVRIYQRFKDKAQFVYASATAAEDVDGLEHLYGLHKWDTDGFGSFKLRLTSADTTARAGKRKRGLSASFDKSGKSPFKREVPLTMMEQITRELKMDGQYIGRQLSMEGVSMEGLPIKISSKEMGDWNRAVQFVGMIAEKAEMYGRSKDGSQKPKARGQIISQVVGYMRRLSGYYRMKAIIADIKAQMDKGDFERFGIIAEFKRGDDGQPANLFAAINAINTQDPIDTGDDIIYADIPEAIDDKAQLLAILQGLNPEWGEQPVPVIPSPMELLYDAFGEDNVAVVSGDVKQSERPKVVKEFQEMKKNIIWFNSAGGTGVNMHDTVGVPIRVYTQDYPYNAKAQKQAEGRFNRTGQITKPTYVYPYLNSSTDTKFVGTLIARYEAMGALSRGDVGKLGGKELANFDLTGEAAEIAAIRIIPELDEDVRAQMFGEFTRDIPFLTEDNVIDETAAASAYSGNAPEVKKFLNALMFLEYETSSRVFDQFTEKMKEVERELEEKGGVKDKFETFKGKELETQVGKNGIKLRKIQTILTKNQQKALDYDLKKAQENEQAMEDEYEKVKVETLQKLEKQVEDIERKQQENATERDAQTNLYHDLRRKLYTGKDNVKDVDVTRAKNKLDALENEYKRRDERLRETKKKLKALKDGNEEIIETIADMRRAQTRQKNARLIRMGAEANIERSDEIMLVDGKIATNGLLVNIRQAIRKAASEVYGGERNTPAMALTLELRGYELDNGERAIGAVVPKWAEGEVAKALEARMSYTGESDDIEQLKAFLKAGNKVSLQGGYELEYQPKLQKFRINGMTVSKDSDLFRRINKDRPLIGFDQISRSFVIANNDGFKEFLKRFPILEKKVTNVTSKPSATESNGPVTTAGTRTAKGYSVDVKLDKHTQTGEDIWLVKPIDTIPKEKWGEFAGHMKKYGGTYYGKFTKGNLRKFMGNFVFQKNPEPAFDKEPTPPTNNTNAQTVNESSSNDYNVQSETGKDIQVELENRVHARNGDNLGIVSPLFRSNTQTSGSRKYSFSDADIQERIDAAEEIPKQGIRKTVKDWLSRTARRMTREFEHLPNTGLFSPLRHALLRLEKQRSVAIEKTARNLQGLLIDLNRDQYELFRNLVLTADLVEEAKAEHDLPFGFTKESLNVERARLITFLKDEPLVKEAITLRTRLWDSIKKDYIKAFDQIGVDVSRKFTKRNYYRHLIIEKAQEKKTNHITGKKELKTPKGQGYMKQRHGSEKDFVTDYLLAESEVMANMYFDMEVAKTIHLVDQQYNEEPNIRRLVDAENEKNFNKLIDLEMKEFERRAELDGMSEEEADKVIAREKLGLPEHAKEVIKSYLDRYKFKLGKNQATMIEAAIKGMKNRVGWAYAELKKLAEDGTLWMGKNDEYEDIVEGLAAGTNDTDKNIWFEYLADLFGSGEEGSEWAGMYLKFNRLQKSFKKDVIGDKYKTVEGSIPEGYEIWRPDNSNVFYMANTIKDYVFDRLFNGAIDELTEGDFSKALVLGGKRKGFIVRSEVKTTLENLMEPQKFDTLKSMLRSVKSVLLTGPTKIFKYNTRNMAGDLDKVIAGNPDTFKYFFKAADELKNVFFKHTSPSKELKAWLEHGGVQTLIQSQEFGDLKHLAIFRNKMIEKEVSNLSKAMNMPKHIWNGYWNTARKLTDYREAILRYASFLSYLDQLEKNNGKPKNYGASLRQEIDALGDNYTKAFNLSNDLLIAYDKTSVTGKFFRDTFFPFFSYIEGNGRSYVRLFKNAYYDENVTGTIGRKLLVGLTVKSPMTAIRTGKLALKVGFLAVLLTMWNKLLFPDEEKDLPEDVQNTIHIIYGRDPSGKVLYFNRLGTLEDFLGWFGMDDINVDVADILDGKRTFQEVIGMNTLKPLNKTIQAVNPIAKQAVEQVAGVKFYPDFTQPQKIGDRVEYLFSLFGGDKEYAALRDTLIGRPHKPYKEENLFVDSADPEETNYYTVRDHAQQTAEKVLGKKKGTMLNNNNPKSEALYQVKLGLHYKDMDYAEKNLEKYISLGGNTRGLKQSLKSLDPLYSIPTELRQQYIDSLKTEEQERIKRAYDFYQKVLLNNIDPDSF